MKTFLLIIFLILVPLLLGMGILTLMNNFKRLLIRIKSGNASSARGPERLSLFSARLLPKAFVTGALAMVLLAEAAHLLTLFRAESLSYFTKTFAILVISIATLCYLAVMISVIIKAMGKFAAGTEVRSDCNNPDNSPSTPAPAHGYKKATLFVSLSVVVLILVQLFLVASGRFVSYSQDITEETVVSFLSSDRLYEINPMTGAAYTEGIPNHLRILCLPTLYACLCKTFEVSASVLVWQIMPVFWLVCAYLTYWCLATTLFRKIDDFDDNTPANALEYALRDGISAITFPAALRRAIFLLMVSVCVFGTDLCMGGDGFGLLHCGYLGTSIRAFVLIPFLLACLLERQYVLALLPLVTEASIVWTSFGLGSCAVIYVGLVLVNFLLRMIQKRKAPMQGTYEEPSDGSAVYTVYDTDAPITSGDESSMDSADASPMDSADESSMDSADKSSMDSADKSSMDSADKSSMNSADKSSMRSADAADSVPATAGKEVSHE